MHACLLLIIFVLLYSMLCLVQIALHLLIICINTYLFVHLCSCLALCRNIPADCFHKSHPDSESDPSRARVRIYSANSRFSNLIPFSPLGLIDLRFHHCMSVPHTIQSVHCLSVPHTVQSVHCMSVPHTVYSVHCMSLPQSVHCLQYLRV